MKKWYSTSIFGIELSDLNFDFSTLQDHNLKHKWR